MANPKDSSPPPPSPVVLHRAVARAIDSLLRWVRSHAKKHNKPLSSPVHLILFMNRPTTTTGKRHLIPLPHPLQPIASTSICLIFDDRPNSPLKLASVKDTLASKSIPVSNVIPFTSFTSELKAQAARRDLIKSHDVLFVDSRIIQMLCKLVGERLFKKKRRRLLPIDLSVKSRWKEQVESKCGSATLYLTSTSECCDVTVAEVSMGRDEIIDNVIAVIEGAVEKVSGRWDNVRSIAIKIDESIPLPIYPVIKGFDKDAERCGDDVAEGEKVNNPIRKNVARGVEESVVELTEARKKRKA